ncbi:hypothetical protein N7478_011616 [Penicillium angulare]|uniref:uncharacterized protein n=1 Tax=Penicillium angulare TaxID=116970 RepID=UPI00254066A6|nr:uncharacterized protein N7478_011616 [Penicillium angulare]KAJ5261021.1 hypothetical protein N7478_011616 [Penicillium angulare]
MSVPQIFVEQGAAHVCEAAEAIHIRRQAEQCAQIYPKREVLIQEPPTGGVAIRSLPDFEGKLNRVVGCGKNALLQESDLSDLKAFYAAVGLTPEIHLSPFAPASTLKILADYGYVERAVLSTHWCDIKEWANRSAQESPASVSIRQAEPYEAERFMEASVAGFQDKPRAPEVLHFLAELAIRRGDLLYFALVDGEIAGTAVMARIETQNTYVAHFYLDSTIPEYRGRGVHLALIQARLRAAHRLGFSSATAITSVGDGSARNAERAGLRIAYNIPVFVIP